MIYSQDLLDFISQILIVVSKFHVMRHYYYPNFTHNFLVMIVNVLTIEKALYEVKIIAETFVCQSCGKK